MPTGVGGAPDALAVELHRMRLSLGEISRERDALRSHVRLLHQQLADGAISTALTQRKPGRAALPASGALRGGGGGGGGGVASGAKPSLGKEAVKELNARLHGPPEKVSRQAHLRWLEAQQKAQSRVKKRLDKKLENKEALEVRAPNSTTARMQYACAHAATARAQASVKQLYQTAVDRRNRLNEKNETQREQMYAKKANSMARAEMLQSASRLHSHGAKTLQRPLTARSASPSKPAWGSRAASATPRSPPATARPSSAPRSRPRERVY